jgi:hypothetical protein
MLLVAFKPTVSPASRSHRTQATTDEGLQHARSYPYLLRPSEYQQHLLKVQTWNYAASARNSTYTVVFAKNKFLDLMTNCFSGLIVSGPAAVVVVAVRSFVRSSETQVAGVIAYWDYQAALLSYKIKVWSRGLLLNLQIYLSNQILIYYSEFVLRKMGQVCCNATRSDSIIDLRPFRYVIVLRHLWHATGTFRPA